MTTSQDLLDLVFGALTAAYDTTDAERRVYRPGDWPTQSDQYPLIKLRLASEDRQSLARSGPPEFTTIATVQILAEVAANAQVANAGGSAAEAKLWALKRQIEVAIVNSYPLLGEIQQIPTMRSQISFDSSGGQHLATLQIDLGLEFYEGPESFAPIASDQIDDALIDVTHYPPAGGLIPLS